VGFDIVGLTVDHLCLSNSRLYFSW